MPQRPDRPVRLALFEQTFQTVTLLHHRAHVRSGGSVRWDHLRLTEDQNRPDLPLIERQAVARTFDTPEFQGMTFYEIQARSVINKVPPASRMSFQWTINPYRGCSHSCTYCTSGETPILMADGRVRPIKDIRPGDRIYGTERRGRYLRYTPTKVLDHWSTIKPAYRTTLEDGTELITSGDHRFLTDRGWKHVSDAPPGCQRPHLTTQNRLLGTGGFGDSPKDTAEYRRGYLCGMLRGDAHLDSRWYDRSGVRKNFYVHCFRLALVDDEALDRTADYLLSFSIPTNRGIFQKERPGYRRMDSINAYRWDAVSAITQIIAWPTFPTMDWSKGFLAGIFDAEGNTPATGEALRISNTDPQILHQIQTCLWRLGFECTKEASSPDREKPVCTIRLLGGLRARLRFFHLTDPVITRKRIIDGMAVKAECRTRVVSIEPLGFEIPLYDITTGTGDYVSNGVISHNCFARKTHEYLELDAGADFDSKIVVKVNAAEVVRRELAAPRWRGEHIAMGTNVDCYQRAEGRYRLMPGILTALRDAANPFSILTKGSLILRDLPLLVEANERAEVSTAVSVGFLDKELWRLVEPGTPAPQKRLEVCATINEAGIGCAVLIGPVLPYLTDSPAQLEEVVRRAAQAGATSVTPITLHLRPGAREWFLSWLREHRPELVVPYARLYGGRAYAPKAFQDKISQRVRELADKHGIGRRPHRDVRRRADGPTQLTLL
ncbi:intein-containing Rv2578c family radical SAM protein [Actinomadura barringtoniae]|uniref:Intein-containing Rv2578c family radical SAM protein n=1 Tax=Actinomadura barringtoniae TaxID=1427535 RepID=A0A939TC23_9ACTN|nr:intein-containing Rv2578c family radical SAM protein [Actinomadura barringtoniae]MBO2454117.1 intein-containing Rv2578c family radical SAM protein [Actinomadura barringtoniae]